MNIPAWLSVSIYSILLLLFIRFSARRQSSVPSPQQNSFFELVLLTVLTFAADCCSRLPHGAAWLFPIAAAGTYLKYLAIPLLGLIWFRYVSLLIMNRVEEKWYRRLIAIYVLNAALVLTNPATKAVFLFDAQHVYHRGPLFWLSTFLMFSTVAVTEVFVLVNRNQIEKQYFFTLTFFSVPPILLGILQGLFYGLPLALIGVTFSLLNVFIYIQNRDMDIDYLTGVYNRRKLDIRMRWQIRGRAEKTAFSMILLDLDHFKLINDALGHNSGDLALIDAVAVLRQSLRPTDFIARFGGDEFCIMLDVSDPEELDRVIARIRENVQAFNEQNSKPYRLSFSMGYAIYGPSSQMSLDEFQEKVDRLMYEDKRNNHRNQENPVSSAAN